MTSQTEIKDRCIGALVGLAVGDALGTTLEFAPRDSYAPLTDMVGGGPFHLQPGQWTDDTSMALCLAESLLKFPDFNAIDCTRRWIRWWQKGHNSCTGACFDIGGQTSAALRAWQAGRPAELLALASAASSGNGGIMRLAPAVIRWHRHPMKALEVAIAQSKATHPNNACIDHAWLLARALLTSIEGYGDAPVPTRIKTRERSDVKSTGYVKDTREAAMWALSFGDGFENIVLRAVNLGGDADTVGAVAGQLAGATYGLSGIPERWVSRLAWSDRIIKLATDLYEAGRHDSHSPRDRA